MRSGELLTLALSENKINHYHVVGYLYDICDFVFFNINKFTDTGRLLLDIGAVSKIYYCETDNENEIEIIGDIVLDRYLNKEEFISFLDVEKTSFPFFKRNVSMKFSIVKLKFIEEIIVNSQRNKLDSYAIIIADGVKEKLKIKDYRWVKYWDHVLSFNDISKLKNRINHYKNFFNEHSSYILLYRFKNENGYNNRFKNTKDIYWISGIFYI